MGFDQNPTPNDLRPLNIVRTAPEDPRIAPVTSSGRPMEGFYANPSQDVGGSPGTMPPVYYQTTVPDATGFVPLGFSNAVPGITGWVQHVVSPQPQPQSGIVGVSAFNSASGSGNSSTLGTKVRSSASDHASDEGGDGSVSGRKIKFLCSFGGNILPRPSDGALRYVGGQTRIISVRRDVSFGEFVQKLSDIYGENALIKYQLPDEDLDALVSVSCSDDLENMMDEYEKLIERSSDGSAKLRIFLFSPAELDTSGLHLGYLQDSGQKYVEAVNGITDGFSGGSSDRIARKESLESAISGQGSDLSGTEGADSFVRSPREVTSVLPSTGGLSPKGTSGVPLDASSRMVPIDPNAIPYSAPSVSIPILNSGPPATLAAISEKEIERSVAAAVPQAPPVLSFAASLPYVQSYIDPHQETSNHPNYVQLPSQMGFPPHVLGPVRPVLTQQPITVGASTQQFTPAVHMPLNPSYLSMKPNAIPAVVQPQHVQLEHYPAESMASQRLVPLPAYNAQQSQVPTTVQVGVHNWPQSTHPEPIALSEGGLPPQQTKFPENIPRFEDCLMCQKALPHAHSDSIAQELKETPASTRSDLRSNYHSLLLDDCGWAPMRPVVTGTIAEGNIGGSRPRVVGNENHEFIKNQTEAIGVSQNVEGQFGNNINISQKAENPEHSKVTLPQGVMMTSGVQYPHGVFVANSPLSYQATAAQNLVVQPQIQVMHDTAINKQLIDDVSTVSMPLQPKDHVSESSNDYTAKVAGGVPIDDSTSIVSDHLRQINRRLENLHVSPSEILSNHDYNKPGAVTAPWKENVVESRLHQIPRGEPPDMQTFPPAESKVMTEPPLVGIQDNYSLFGASNLHLGDASGNSIYPGVGPAVALNKEKILPIIGQKDNIVWAPLKTTGEALTHDRSSILPSDRVGDIADNLASVLINQDSWNMLSDAHSRPPRPSKIQIRKEYDVMKNTSDDNIGEASSGNCREPPLEALGENGAYQPSGNLNWDFNLDNSLPSQRSAEELIKQELQAVAEGVASSVLNSSVASNTEPSMSAQRASPNAPQQSGDEQSTNLDGQHRDTLGEIKTKLPQKINFGFPASGIGRLQIIKNSDLEELRELGSGTFGTVYHGKWRGTDVAIKRINDRCFAGKPSEQDRMRDDFWNEAIKLADLHHPNVVAFYGVVLDGPDGSVATVTEYMVNGSLRNALQKNERSLDKRKRLLIGMDVAFGMEYLHGKNIVHFDLKSDNLLVNLRDQHRPICKVGDLGLSKVKCKTLISGGVRGTLPWMAPELLNGSSSLVSEKVDVFSFGIVMWELLTGDEPYADLHYGAIIGGIVSNTLRPPVPEPCDPDWRALMERCWASDSSDRPNFTEIANELRAMAAKLPPKGQAQQQLSSTNPQVKS